MAGDDLTDVIEHVVPLAEMVASLRRELAVAVEQADELPGPRLLVTRCELELQIVIKQTDTGKGGLRFLVLRAGAERSRGNETTHTIRLQLEPEGGRPVPVSSRKKRR